MNFIDFYTRHDVKDLKRAGKFYQGYCPFHADKGSEKKGFVVIPDNGIWRCYSGCQGSGCQNGAWHNDITFCKLKDIPIEEAPSYDRKYRRYGYPGGAVLKKPHDKKKHDFWAGAEDRRARNPWNPEAIDLAREEKRALWICEGAKDAETMLATGELATAIPNATGFNVFEGISLDDIPEVIIACDNDTAGRNATEQLKDRFVFAKVVVWPATLPKGYDVTDLKEEAVDKHECNLIEELRRYVKDDTWQDEGELADSFLLETERGRPPYIKTGFKIFDDKIDGLMPGGLHVLQGSSSIGKTTFCKQLADQVKENNPGLPIFFFTLEDSLHTVRAMTLSRLSHDEQKSIENRLIRKGGKALTGEQIAILKTVTPKVKEIYGKHYYLVAGEPDIDVRQIRERVERKLNRIGKDTALIIVDFLQILPVPRTERLSSLMDRIDFNLHELQCLARDINGPVILTSSTTKEDIKDTDKKREAGLAKGKGSVNILYTPRMLFELIEKPEDKSKPYRQVEFYVLKNSEGWKALQEPLQTFRYYPEYSKFM